MLCILPLSNVAAVVTPWLFSDTDAAAAVVQARRRFALVQAATRIGTLRIDLAAESVALDAAAAAQHGLAEAAVTLRIGDWLSSIAAPDHAQVWTMLAQSVVAGDQRLCHTYAIAPPGGARRIALHLDSDQPRSAVWAICRDVTAQPAIDELQRQIAAADRRQRDHIAFLSRVSHELRTPMNAILGFTHLLRTDSHAALAEHQRRWLDQVQHGGRHLLALINDVLDLSRATAAPHSLHLEPVDLRAALSECLDMLRPIADAAQVTLAPSRLPPDCWLQADRRGLHQLLMNLVGNAVKFNRPGGRVECHAVRDGRCWRLAVSDDGPGIPPARMARLFVPFERLGAECGAVGGTGLGLAIAKELTTAMGGTIDASCPPGGGTCLALSLPAAEPALVAASAPAKRVLPAKPPPQTPAAQIPPPGTAAPPAGQPPAADGCRKAVYVEDEIVNAQLMQAVFRLRDDWALQLIDSAEEVMHRLLADPPQLLLLDLHLPKRSGFELLRLIRAEPTLAGLRCVAVSADAMPATLAAARDAEFDDFWTKPFDLRQLNAWLDDETARWRAAGG